MNNLGINKMTGLYLEDCKIGEIIKHEITKTVTENDNMMFSTMTYNTQPLHIDKQFSENTEWGKPLVNSFFTLGLVVGLGVVDTTHGTIVGNLGMLETEFPHPVFEGDTIHATTEILKVRESKTKKDRGIVEFLHKGYNQNEVMICYCHRKVMMYKKP